MPGGYQQVTTAVPSRQAAELLARSIVESRLAAVVQVIGPIGSTYWWRGVIHDAEEWLCVAKTTQERLQALAERIDAEHPYEVPEITATPISHGSPAYLAWLDRETAAPSPSGTSRGASSPAGGSSSSGSVR